MNGREARQSSRDTRGSSADSHGGSGNEGFGANGEGGFGADLGSSWFGGSFDNGASFALPGAGTIDTIGRGSDPGYDAERSVGDVGRFCETPIRACRLSAPHPVGDSCACSVPGGRSGGHVAP